MAAVVTVVNRTSKVLHGLWDGVHYDIAPGKHSFPSIQAHKFKDQNPQMGSEDPQTLATIWLIGIEEDGDDCSPIEQTNAVERWQTAKVPGASKREVIKGNGGLYATERHAPMASDDTFFKP